ncbi:probable 2' cyclic ADP-D-ribose synthase BdTIR [Coffea arabica]|uniref:Probable 2' cyclic ADP-D-ribose synthase BdTIR n=1 Tax=Coffea arabica TaxID=13443 RepID=A0ABM4UAE5_COFAR|nr:TIR domain-containing protein-like [Coffea arabica]
MQRSVAKNILQRHVLSYQNPTRLINKIPQPPCDVFINHRGVDTKKTIASLLYDHLVRLRRRPFLDNKNMKPGDKLFEKIDTAIKGCKIGVAVFSPTYCQSYFCLHELALIMETKKKVIPIFCDVKPSQLRVVNDGRVPPEQIERFNMALEEAKFTVGLAFDSTKGNWSEVLTDAAEIVMESLAEVENEERMMHMRMLKSPSDVPKICSTNTGN